MQEANINVHVRNKENIHNERNIGKQTQNRLAKPKRLVSENKTNQLDKTGENTRYSMLMMCLIVNKRK